MQFNPAPGRLVVRLTEATPGVGDTGTGEIVELGSDLVASPKLSYKKGDYVLFGRPADGPVFSIEEGIDLIVLSADDVLTTLSGKTPVKIVEPAAAKRRLLKHASPPSPSPSTGDGPTLDEYIRQLENLGK